LFLPSPISAFIGDWICNRFGRRPAVWLGSGITLISIIFMTACQSTLQFMGARLILGFGGTIAKQSRGACPSPRDCSSAHPQFHGDDVLDLLFRRIHHVSDVHQ
jgi:hypothetical protein